MKTWRAPLAALTLVSALTADPYPRQPGVDVQHYVFQVTLHDDSGAIDGETGITVRFLRDGLTEWALDLASPAGGKGMTVTVVASGGAPVRYTHQSNRLRMTLDPPSKAGELRRFTVRYHGVPAGGLLAVKNKFGDRCFFSVNWPDQARQWLPVIDHPYDKASSEFIVIAPAAYRVVSNGRMLEQRSLGDGRRRTHWSESVPIATWLDDIGVARFATRDFGRAAGAPLEGWLFPKDREAGIATLENPMRQAMEFFRERIGPYPYEKLAGVEAAGMSGGMEVASAIFFGQEAITGQPAFTLAAHEVAHQWFGDSVTEKDWDDVWLSEGFATYFALLAVEHYQGGDAFQSGLEASRRRVFAAEAHLPGVAVVQNKTWTGIPNPIVYQKGAWVLHMLREEIGTEKFWAGIREYYRRFRDGNASTADLEKVVEEVSGRDLGWFFRQWLYRAGSPVVEGNWRYDGRARTVELELRQTGAGEPYRLPLEIGLADARGKKRIVPVELTAPSQKFEIPAGGAPLSVELDPRVRLLFAAHLERR